MKITWVANFFEGISEATTDFADEKRGDFIVPKDESSLLNVHMNNSDFGGGDITDISPNF